MSEKSAYLKQLEAQLEEWDAEIGRLRARAKTAQAEAQLESEEQLKELRARRKETFDRMEELRQAGEGAWQDMKAGLEGALLSFQNAIDKARARFR